VCRSLALEVYHRFTLLPHLLIPALVEVVEVMQSVSTSVMNLEVDFQSVGLTIMTDENWHFGIL